MQIELDVHQLPALIEHLGRLTFRYEAESAAFAALGEPGREIAEQRLKYAREAENLQDYLLSK